MDEACLISYKCKDDNCKMIVQCCNKQHPRNLGNFGICDDINILVLDAQIRNEMIIAS